VYRSAEIVAGTNDTRDLALIRLATADKMAGKLELCPTLVVTTESGFSALAVGCGEGAAATCLVAKVLGKKLVRRELRGLRKTT
jgi:hypothetical protein